MVGIAAQPVKKTMYIRPYRATQGARSLVISSRRSSDSRANNVTKSKTQNPGADDSAGPAPAKASKPSPPSTSFDLEAESDELASPSLGEEGDLSEDGLVDDGDSWGMMSEAEGDLDDDIDLTDDGADGYEDEYEISEELLEDDGDSLADVLDEGSLALDDDVLAPLTGEAGDSGGISPPAPQMEEIPDGPMDSVQLELASEDDAEDPEDDIEVEGALLEGLEIEAALEVPVDLDDEVEPNPDPGRDPGDEPAMLDDDDLAEEAEDEADDGVEWTSLDDEKSDPFLPIPDPDSVPDLPLINPYSGSYGRATGGTTETPLDLEPDVEDEPDEEEAALDLVPDAAADFHGRAAPGSEPTALMNEPDADWIDPMDAEDEVEWLREEAARLSRDDQIDEQLSVLDRLMRLAPGEEGLNDQYEDVLTRVIQVYFPGKTPDSIPKLTVQAWELPDLVRDPAMGAILGRMDGHTPLRDIYSVLPDQEPGTVYRLLSRAKGKGLVRLDEME